MTATEPKNPLHPGPRELAAFLQGRLDEPAQRRVEAHVAECPECCRLLAAVPDDTLIEGLRATNPGDAAPGVGPMPGSAAGLSLPPALRDHPRYRIVRVLGTGGMGVVYQAEHRLMERAVALKVIHPHVLSHPLAVERFRREVKAAARLSHANIVTAYDAEQAGGLHFLAMEYVEGTSLAQRVHDRGPLPVPWACECVRQAAAGLQHAMEQGMVHRDVKPQNLMLTSSGEAGGVGTVKILDFGLARLARHDEPALPPSSSGQAPPRAPAMTAASSMLGTLEYMAPEQAQSARDVDIRADIYSLGRTLEFLLTGKPPARGPDATVVSAPATGKRAVAPRSLSSGLPRRLAAIVQRMTAVDPAQRYQTPAEVAAALKPWTRPASTLSRVLSARRYTIAATVGAVVLLAMAGVWQGMKRTPPAPAEGTPSRLAVPSAVPAKPARGSSRLLVVLPEEFDPADYKALMHAAQGRFSLEIASTSSSPCRPLGREQGGPSLRPAHDLSAGPLDLADYGAIVFLGGNIHLYKQPDAPLGPAVGRLLAQARACNMPIVAIGHGIRVLAVLDEFRDTRLALGDERYRAMFPGHRHWNAEPGVVEDGRVFSASEPSAAREILDRIHLAGQ